MFDYLALGDENMHGSPLRAEEWATVTYPTLVVYGSKTYSSLKPRVSLAGGRTREVRRGRRS
jgi:hypothetical protein